MIVIVIVDDIADTNGNESQTTLTPRQFSREGLKVFPLNINSIPKHLDELRIFIEEKKPHAVCLNETKIDDTIDNEVLEIDDYQLLRNDRTRHGGGVAMYLHRSVQFTSRDEFNIIGLETLSVEIKLPFTKPIILSTIYRPEATVEVCECINKFVDKIISEDKEFILMGDMNCNMLAKPLDNTKYMMPLA